MGKNPIRIDHADGIFYGQRGKNADVPNSYLFLVSGPFAADIFEPRSRADYMGGADGLDGCADRNGDVAQVHADQSVTDVDSGMCLNKFHSAGMLEFIPCRGGEGTAGL